MKWKYFGWHSDRSRVYVDAYERNMRFPGTTFRRIPNDYYLPRQWRSELSVLVGDLSPRALGTNPATAEP